MSIGDSAPRYMRPGWFTTRVFNPLVAALTRAASASGAHASCGSGDAPAANGAEHR
jgi:hypothetical protein